MNLRQLASSVFVFIIIIIGNTIIRAQGPEVLATGGGQNFTVNDLTRGSRAAYENLKTGESAVRTEILESWINTALLEEEAKLRKLTVDKLLDAEVIARIPAPTEAQIKEIYDANREQLGDYTLEQVKKQIVSFLRRKPEEDALLALVANLKKKIKVTNGVDVNSAALKPTDMVVTVGTQKILAADFNERAKGEVFDFAFQSYRQVVAGLQEAIFLSLVLIEARSLGIQSEEFIAREITNKSASLSAAEQSQIEVQLRDRLFKKYNVKIVLPEPEAPVQKISVDDDPSLGNKLAPVTIVMFSDFQCSACSAVHPIVKDVMQQYGDKVRLVVRDYPLDSIHENARKAAQAANAANAQGKFFEYIDILYKNQSAQDTPSLKKYATQLGLDRAKFDADLDKDAYTTEIEKDITDGGLYGVRGTPTLFVNGRRVNINSTEYIKKLIDLALTQKP